MFDWLCDVEIAVKGRSNITRRINFDFLPFLCDEFLSQRPRLSDILRDRGRPA